jgi:carboxymethylenebutenolidase
MTPRPTPSHELSTPLGELPTHVSVPAGAGPWPAVVVIHDATGMTTDLVNQTRWLADAGFIAAAPDLLRGGTIARCMRELIRDYATWEGHAFEQIEAVRAWLAGREDCTGRVGVIGFCLGGSFALSLAPGHGFAAASANYGALPKDAERYFTGACPIIGSYGRRDRTLKAGAARLHAALQAAGVEHDVKEYPDAGHGFINDHAPGEVPMFFQFLGATVHTKYHQPSADDARARIIDFFTHHLADTTQPGSPPR